MPNQVYRLNPQTGAVRVVATDFDKCNGIAFTGDGQTAYMCVPFYSDRAVLADQAWIGRAEPTLAHLEASSETIRLNPRRCEPFRVAFADISHLASFYF
jgi:hypothetical protein